MLTSCSVSSFVMDNLSGRLEGGFCCSQPDIRAKISPSLPLPNPDDPRRFLRHYKSSVRMCMASIAAPILPQPNLRGLNPHPPLIFRLSLPPGIALGQNLSLNIPLRFERKYQSKFLHRLSYIVQSRTAGSDPYSRI